MGARRFVLLLLLVSAAAGCVTGRTAPLRVGLPPWVPAEFAYVARELGFFDDHEVELIPYGSVIELSRHLREGNLDAAALPLDFVPYWITSLRDLDVVFVLDVSNGGDAVVAKSDLRNLEALRGRRIGVESSPIGAHMLLRALTAGGLHERDVEVVPMDSEVQADAFASGKVDAVVTRDPDRSVLLAAGAFPLFDTSQAPGQVVDVLVLPTATAAAHADALRKLVAGWLAAYAYLGDNRAASVERIAAGLSLDVEAVERSLAGVRLGELAINQSMLGGSPPRLAPTLAEIADLAKGAGLMEGGDLSRVRCNPVFLPGLVARPTGVLPGAALR